MGLEGILWAVGGFLLVLTPIVLVHELGHFVAARLYKIRVEEFGFGLPPRALVLAKRGGTLFTLNWIPLGGFVRPAGEDDPAVEGGLAAASKRARFFVLVAGAGANFTMAFLIWWVAYVVGPPAVAVGYVEPGTPAAAGGLQAGDFFVRVDGRTALTSNDIAGPMFAKGGQRVEVVVKRNGELVTLNVTPRTAGEYDPSQEGPLGVRLVYSALRVTAVAPGSPAAQAGLLPGDILLLEWNDSLVTTVAGLEAYLAAQAGQTIPLTISRNGQLIETAVVAQGNRLPGATIVNVQERTSRGALESANAAFQSIWAYMTLFVRVPAMLISGEMTPSEARPVSVVGISQIAGQMVESSATNNTLFPILNITAFISVALGLTNLLPIPALDGGRILFVLIEAVRGRRIEPEREGRVHIAGMLILLGLMVILIMQDILNPIVLPK